MFFNIVSKILAVWYNINYNLLLKFSINFELNLHSHFHFLIIILFYHFPEYPRTCKSKFTHLLSTEMQFLHVSTNLKYFRILIIENISFIFFWKLNLVLNLKQLLHINTPYKIKKYQSNFFLSNNNLDFFTFKQ